MTAYKGLFYCNNIGEISVGEGIWEGGEGNPRVYGIMS